LITGIHGENPVALYSELCEVIENVVSHFKGTGRDLPPVKIRPMSSEVKRHPLEINEIEINHYGLKSIV